jgi:uncharacterized protein YecT (DUF1311 family)
MLRRHLPFQPLALALILSTPLSHAGDRFELLAQCAANSSHVEQRECLERKMKESLVALGGAQKELMIKLRSVDVDAADKQRAIVRAQTDAQEYITYAGKHCESFASLTYGGNSQQDRRLACHAELNSIRAQQVSKVSASIP